MTFVETLEWSPWSLYAPVLAFQLLPEAAFPRQSVFAGFLQALTEIRNKVSLL